MNPDRLTDQATEKYLEIGGIACAARAIQKSAMVVVFSI